MSEHTLVVTLLYFRRAILFPDTSWDTKVALLVGYKLWSCQMKPKKKPKLEPIASATLGDKSTYHFYEVDNVTLKMVDTTNSRRQILISKVCLQGLIAAFADLDEKYPF